MKENNLKRITFLSFCLAAVFAATSLYYGFYSARYERYISASSQMALSTLISSSEQMRDGLNKMQYGTDGVSLAHSAAQVWSASQSAKAALSVLPIADAHLMQYEKFLNQTGNFALSLITSGKNSSVTDAQIASIKAITSSLDEISPFVLQAKEKMDIGEITLGGPIRTSGVTTLSSALGQIENDFLPYGQLNYDGEYSQHTEDIKPKFLDKAQKISSDDALKIAKQLVGSDSNDIKLLYETNGSIPVYAYGNKNLTIEITKNGGIVLSIHNKRDVRESKVSKDSASKTALQFAEKLGFKGLSCRYITQSDNILTVELIGSQDNVTIYPDRVTVGVALDNGKVVYFDSRGYILSHTERTLTLPDEIPDGANLAIIPTKGNLEHLCFEYEEEDHIRYVCTTEGTCYAVHPFGDGERDGLISR